MSGCYPHLLLNCLKIHHSRDALPNPGLVVSAWWLILPYRNTPFAQAGRTLGQSTWNGGRGCSARRGEQVSIPHDNDDSICVPRWQRKFGRSFAQLKQIPQETPDLQSNGRKRAGGGTETWFEMQFSQTISNYYIHLHMTKSEQYSCCHGDIIFILTLSDLKTKGSDQDSTGSGWRCTLPNASKC